jgi:hypothetical protein
LKAGGAITIPYGLMDPEVFVLALARAGGFAIPASCAACAGLEAVIALAFEMKPSVEADQL